MAPSPASKSKSSPWTRNCDLLRLPDATEIPFRLTMVRHQEYGCWKIVQNHFSIGVGNDDAEAAGRP